ncbi:MAG: hypothetical protein N3A57_07930, partial [Negativicutes bacterium]|nr:hypothetical protein [Negativicutes bacterium]
MRLTTKITLLQVAAIAVIVATVSTLGYFFGLKEYTRLELAEHQRDLKRLEFALDQQRQNIVTITSDWAFWDEMLAFVAGGARDEQFVASTVSASSLLTINIYSAVWFDSVSHPLIAVNLDPDSRAEVKANSFSIYLDGHRQQLVPSDISRTASGFVRTGDGQIWLYAVLPITDSKQSAPAAGQLLFARPLDDSLLETISQSVQIPVELFPPEHPELQSSLPSGDLDPRYAFCLEQDPLRHGLVFIRDPGNQVIGGLR